MVDGEAGKGSQRRREDPKKIDKNWPIAFGKRKPKKGKKDGKKSKI